MNKIVYSLLFGMPLGLAVGYYCAFVINAISYWFGIDFIYSLGTLKVYGIILILYILKTDLSFYRKSETEEAQSYTLTEGVTLSISNHIMAFFGINTFFFYAFLIKTFII